MLADPLLTKRDLARALRVSVRTIDNLPLRRVYVGGSVRFRPADVDEYLRARARPVDDEGSEAVGARAQVEPGQVGHRDAG